MARNKQVTVTLDLTGAGPLKTLELLTLISEEDAHGVGAVLDTLEPAIRDMMALSVLAGGDRFAVFHAALKHLGVKKHLQAAANTAAKHGNLGFLKRLVEEHGSQVHPTECLTEAMLARKLDVCLYACERMNTLGLSPNRHQVLMLENDKMTEVAETVAQVFATLKPLAKTLATATRNERRVPRFETRDEETEARIA